MSNGYSNGEWYYRRPILDRILLWFLQILWCPLRMLSRATEAFAYTLRRLDLRLWSKAYSLLQIQHIVYPTESPTEESGSTTSLGGREYTLNIEDGWDNTSYPGTTKLSQELRQGFKKFLEEE